MEQIKRLESFLYFVLTDKKTGFSHLNSIHDLKTKNPTFITNEYSTRLLSFLTLYHAHSTSKVNVLSAAILLAILKATKDADKKDAQATVMINANISAHRIELNAVLLYCSVLAATQFKNASIATRSAQSGLFALLFGICFYGRIHA